ncbi:hypothetical protein D3C87_1988820 [compost metagenome]
MGYLQRTGGKVAFFDELQRFSWQLVCCVFLILELLPAQEEGGEWGLLTALRPGRALWIELFVLCAFETPDQLSCCEIYIPVS